MPTKTTMPPAATCVPDVPRPTAQARRTTLFDLLCRHRRLTEQIRLSEDTLRTMILDWLATDEDPATTRQWLLSQPFATLGIRLPETCLADLADTTPPPGLVGSTTLRQSVLTHEQALHLTSTAKLVMIDGGQCRVWKNTDAAGKTALVYVPFHLVSAMVMAGEGASPDSPGAYKLEPARAINSRFVIPLGLPTYLQGTLYRSLELQRLLTVLNTPSEIESTTAREVVDELLAHGKTRHFFDLFNAFAPGSYLPRVQAEDIDAGPYQPWFTSWLGDAAEIPEGHTEGAEQWMPVTVHTGEALWRWSASKDPWRLKRCIECRHYFFDATKNGRRKHCTARCKSRHTSRDYYRRRAAHADHHA